MGCSSILLERDTRPLQTSWGKGEVKMPFSSTNRASAAWDPDSHGYRETHRNQDPRLHQPPKWRGKNALLPRGRLAADVILFWVRIYLPRSSLIILLQNSSPADLCISSNCSGIGAGQYEIFQYSWQLDPLLSHCAKHIMKHSTTSPMAKPFCFLIAIFICNRELVLPYVYFSI